MTTPPSLSAATEITQLDTNAFNANVELVQSIYTKSSKARKELFFILDAITDEITCTQNDTEDTTPHNNIISPHSSTTKSYTQLLQTATKLFLQLKQYQRSLGLLVENDLSNHVAQRKSHVETSSLALLNYQYERNHLLQEIHAQKQYQCDELVSMAKEELGLYNDNDGKVLEAQEEEEGEVDVDMLASSEDNNQQEEALKKKKLMNDDEIIDAYLEPSSIDSSQEDEVTVPPTKKSKTNAADGTPTTSTTSNSTTYSHRDVEKHNYTLSKLKSELALRRSLGKELQSSIALKNKLTQQCKDQQEFLNSIPSIVSKLEECASQVQQQFIQFGEKRQDDYLRQSQQEEKGTESLSSETKKDNSAGGIAPELKLIGKTRVDRLNLAASTLSIPLYTLFVQLQNFLDTNCNTPTYRGWNIQLVDSSSTAYGSKGSSGITNKEKDDRQYLHIKELLLTLIRTSQASNEADEHLDKIIQKCQKWLAKDDKAIQLEIPLPDIMPLLTRKDTSSSSALVIAGTSTKTIKIQFEYMSQMNVVTAHVVNGPTKDNMLLWGDHGSNMGGSNSKQQKLLLFQDLFLNDNGTEIPKGTSLRSAMEEKGTISGVDTDSRKIDDDDDNDYMYDESTIVDNREITLSTDLVDTNKNDATINDTIQDMTLYYLHYFIQNDNDVIMKGRPYYWCQNIAGLYYPKSISSISAKRNRNEAEATMDPIIKEQIRVESSTRKVMTQLHRRIRNHATLRALLNFLEKKKPNSIPIHPSATIVTVDATTNSSQETTSTKNSTQTKLMEWTEDKATQQRLNSKCDANEAQHSFKYYHAVIKRKTSILDARVKIDSRYPAISPVWSLSHGEPSVSTRRQKEKQSSPLVNDKQLKSMEETVNKYGLKVAGNGADESNDWVLMHQLRDIIILWDEIQQASEKGESFNQSQVALVSS